MLSGQSMECDLGIACGSDLALQPLTDGAQECLEACNLDVLNTDCGDATIWFEVTTDETALGLFITVDALFNPSLVVLSENCDGDILIPCQTSTNASAEIQASQTYYIGVGVSSGDPGDFELCISTSSIFADCSDSQLTVTRPENPSLDPNGPYLPGEKVEFCSTINFFVDAVGEGNNCQWLQGIVPTIGTGWNTITCPIDEQGPAGSEWFEEGIVNYQTFVSNYGIATNCNGQTILTASGASLEQGTPLPGGWYFISPGAAGCDNNGNPNTGWGLPAGCGSTSTVEFCFELQANTLSANTDCTDPCFSDMEVSIYVFADGQTGCWAQNSCAADIPTSFISGSIDCSVSAVDLDNDGFTSDVDCNDNDPSIFPGAVELCDDIDNNCNGEINEGIQATYFIDSDGDGFGDPNNFITDCQLNAGFSLNNTDCDDTNPDIHPSAMEIPNNGIDEDCNGSDLTQAVDNDNDGFTNDIDCDDSNPNINPDAEEIPNNTIDEDCDGEALIIDEDGDGWNSDEDCDDSNAETNPAATEIIYNGMDDDCNELTPDDDLDGDGFTMDTDCNDDDPAINPSAEDIPNNAIDEDCDGEALIIDEDGDGWNSDEDCDDSNADINPDSTEVPGNGVDEDCDGLDGPSSNTSVENEAVRIYPNPTQNHLIVSTDIIDYEIQLYNAQGIIMDIEKKEDQSLDLTQLTPGIYILIFNSEEHTMSSKIIKL